MINFEIILTNVTYLIYVYEAPLSDEAAEEIGSLQYDFSTIRDATDNFSEENKLGQGGFGAVYKV